MAARGWLNTTVKTYAMSRLFTRMISLSKSPCVNTLNLSHRPFPLSLSPSKTLNLSHRALCGCVSLSSSSLSPGKNLADDEITWRTSLKRWGRSYFSPELNELLDTFDRETTNAKEMTEELRKEYNMKLEKLFEESESESESETEDEDEYDDYLLAEVEDLHYSFWDIIYNRSEAGYVGERVKEVLDWFEEEMMKAKEITEKLRKEMMIMKANKDDNEDELAELYWTLYENQAKAIRSKAAKPAPENKPRHLNWKSVMDWQANNFIVESNELLDWFDKEMMEANDTTQKLRKEYETLIAKLSAEERAVDDEAGCNSWKICFKELEKMLSNLKQKQSKAILAKAKANKLADHQAMAAKLLYPFFVMAHSLSPPPPLASLLRQKKLISDSVNELLDWFDNETMEANDTNHKLRKKYEIIIAKLLAEDRAILVEDMEDLQDFNWELSVNFTQAINLMVFNKDKLLLSSEESTRRRKTEITESDWITRLWEKHVNYRLICFEHELMKIKEKLRKDHEKLLLANRDEEDEAVLVEELNYMFFNLSESKAKAILAKAKASKAHGHKARAADLLSCFFLF